MIGTMFALGLALAAPLRSASRCEDLPQLRSQRGGARVLVRFWNDRATPLIVDWVGQDGARATKLALAPHGRDEQLATTGDLFVARTPEGACLAVIPIAADSTDLAIGEKGLVDPAAARARLPALQKAFDAAYAKTVLGGFPAELGAGTEPAQIERVSAKLAECRALMAAQKSALGRIAVRVDAKLPLAKPAHYVQGAHRLEITDLDQALAWMDADQPQMLCHELAHGVDELAFRGHWPELDAAYAAALGSGLYARVERDGAAPARAYALANAHEYFAELTEAYLGFNNWYPHTREQLERFDPRGYALMQRAWGPPPDHLSCSAASPSPRSSQETAIRFHNGTAAPVTVEWLGHGGERKQVGSALAPGETRDQPTRVGYLFEVVDGTGRCLGLFRADEKPGRAVVAPRLIAP